MCSGVSKSGSPIARLTIVLPWRLSSATRSVTVLLGEGLMRRMRAAMREVATVVLGVKTVEGKAPTGAAPRWLLSGRITAAYGRSSNGTSRCGGALEAPSVLRTPLLRPRDDYR